MYLADGLRFICYIKRHYRYLQDSMLQRTNRAEPDKSYFAELQNGIRSFGNFLITGSFTIDVAVTASAKAAYLYAKLLTGDFDAMEKFNDHDIKTLEIRNHQWNVLNKLKRLPD